MFRALTEEQIAEVVRLQFGQIQKMLKDNDIKISIEEAAVDLITRHRYYWHYSQSSLYWDQANNLVSTGGQPQFNANALGRVKIKVPSIAIQNKITDVLDNFDAICSDLKIGLPAEIKARKKQYEFYRDQLLTFAEGGRTVFTDRQTDRQTDYSDRKSVCRERV